MMETAAHLTDHGFPRLLVRQWVLSVPKRLLYFMQRDGAILNMVLRIFLRVIAQSLQACSPGAERLDKATLHIGAVAFIHPFGSSLNEHVYFHVCVVDGVFEEVVDDPDAQSSSPSIDFHPASAIDEPAVAQVQSTLRRRILRVFVGRGLIESVDAKEMPAWHFRRRGASAPLPRRGTRQGHTKGDGSDNAPEILLRSTAKVLLGLEALGCWVVLEVLGSLLQLCRCVPLTFQSHAKRA
jgi:hypothetical protein